MAAASKKTTVKKTPTNKTVSTETETEKDKIVHLTIDGINITIDEAVMDDYRFMRLMREVQKNDLAAVDMLDKLLGEQMALVEAHYEDPVTGRVPLAPMTHFLETIFEELQSLKN